MTDERTCAVSTGTDPAGDIEDYAGLNVLLIGPTQQQGSSSLNVLGGNLIMMREQRRELSARGFAVTTVDTSGAVTNLPLTVLALSGLFRFSRVMIQVARKLPQADVVCSIQRSKRMWDLGTALWLLCKLFRRPLALRVTGGRLSRRYADCGRLRRKIADRTFMRADILYIETQAVLDELPEGDNLRHFPNTRQIPDHALRDRESVKRLLFLSRIEPQKGLHDCLAASLSLPEDCELSVYGAPTTGVDLTDLRNYPRAVYGGVADPAEIPRILAEHDLLLLPTSHPSEGLPGVIIEALQAGMPVISTRVGGIPELLEDERSGLFIEPHSVSDLEAAIHRLIDDPALYRRLCEGARQRGHEFRSDRWYGSFAADLGALAGSKRERPHHHDNADKHADKHAAGSGAEPQAAERTRSSSRRKPGKPKPTAAVVGTGFVATKHHLPAWTRLKESVELVAVCDIDRGAADAAARRFGASAAYTSVEELLEKARPDFVDICTPPAAHAEIATAALKADAAVLIEKPLAHNLADCEKIIAAAQSSAGRVEVAHSDLYNPVVTEAQERISGGEIGELMGMRIFYVTPKTLYASQQDHFANRLPGGVIGETGPHIAYMANAFIGPVRSCQVKATKLIPEYPWSPFEDYRIELYGERIHCSAVLTYTLDHGNYQIDIWGTDGLLKLDMQAKFLLQHRRRRSTPWIIGQSSLRDVTQILKGTTRNTASYVSGRFAGAHARMIESFVQRTLDGLPPAVGAQDGLECCRIMADLVSQIESAQDPACQAHMTEPR